MTEEADDAESETDRRTLADVSHTHPRTDRPFGDSFAFQRGRTVAADGGRRDAGGDHGDAAGEDAESRTLADVSHTTPNDSEDASRAFQRGHEGEGPNPDGSDDA